MITYIVQSVQNIFATAANPLVGLESISHMAQDAVLAMDHAEVPIVTCPWHGRWWLMAAILLVVVPHFHS